MKPMKLLLTCLTTSLLLTGCLTALDARSEKADKAETHGPTINIPPSQTVDTEKLEKKIGIQPLNSG